MPDQRIVNFEGKQQIFPCDATDAEISAALNAIPESNAAAAPKAKTWAPEVSLVGPLARGAATAAAELATNPNVPAMAAKVGRVIGAVAPIVGGAAEAGPMGAAAGTMAAAKGSWLGGKTGWFTGKLAQSAAAPVANVLEKAAPYAQAVSTAAGAQGALDLAQMAEPNRQDIGFLGMSGKGSASDQAAVIGAQIKALVTQGMKPGEAARTVYNAWAKQLREQTK